MFSVRGAYPARLLLFGNNTSLFGVYVAVDQQSPRGGEGRGGEVWFEDARAGGSHMGLPPKVGRLFEKAGFAGLFSPGDLVAIKVHFGEPGNTAFVSPVLVRRVVDKVKEGGGRPFLTDANTVYAGRRANAVDHINAAIENGFAYSVAGAPIVIADGLTGQEYQSVKINGKHFDQVKIAPAAIYADALIVLSHVKGHILAGFGGAIKNVGMGLGSRSGKREMHSDGLPIVSPGKCSACARCLPWCPSEAMSLANGGDGPKPPVHIDESECIGCGECTVACAKGAISFDWRTDNDTFQEKTAEYAKGVLAGKEGKAGFINFLINMTPDCDCFGWSDPPLLPDVGIIASKDIVAIERASIDLASAAFGGEDPFRAHTGIDGSRVIRYAEEIGLGGTNYRLRTISGSPPSLPLPSQSV